MRPYELNGGRPRKLTDKNIDYIKANIGTPIRKLARQLGVNHGTIYRTLKHDKATKTNRRPHTGSKEVKEPEAGG